MRIENVNPDYIYRRASLGIHYNALLKTGTLRYVISREPFRDFVWNYFDWNARMTFNMLILLSLFYAFFLIFLCWKRKIKTTHTKFDADKNARVSAFCNCRINIYTVLVFCFFFFIINILLNTTIRYILSRTILLDFTRVLRPVLFILPNSRATQRAENETEKPSESFVFAPDNETKHEKYVVYRKITEMDKMIISGMHISCP